MAILLAGDALFTLGHPDSRSDRRSLAAAATVALVEELSFGGGTVGGMIGGQVADIEGERQPPTPELLDSIHRAKTGALLRASVRMGGICGGGDRAQIEALSRYGEHVGLAFQIVDDILDVEELPPKLSARPRVRTRRRAKITFPAVYGLEESRCMAQEECGRAHEEALAPFGSRAPSGCTRLPILSFTENLENPWYKATTGPDDRRPLSRRIPRESSSPDHGWRGPGGWPKGIQSRSARFP